MRRNNDDYAHALLMLSLSLNGVACMLIILAMVLQ